MIVVAFAGAGVAAGVAGVPAAAAAAAAASFAARFAASRAAIAGGSSGGWYATLDCMVNGVRIPVASLLPVELVSKCLRWRSMDGCDRIVGWATSGMARAPTSLAQIREEAMEHESKCNTMSRI